MSSLRLSEIKKAFYRERDNLLNPLRSIPPEEIIRFTAEPPQLLALLKPGETATDVRVWQPCRSWDPSQAKKP
jgi:hypothetical protein